MISFFLVQLTENDKRFIFALLLIFILLIVFIGFLGSVIFRVMKWQGKKTDTLVHDVVLTKVVTNKKELASYGRKKNWRLFFSQATIPLIILLLVNVILLIYEAVKGWNYNPWSIDNGFGSLFFTFKLGDYQTWWIFAVKKIEVVHYPTFNIANWCGYLYCPIFLVGLGWYLVVVQSLISRTIRLYKLENQVFEKSLDGFNQNVFDKPIENNTVNNQNNTETKQ